MHTCRIGGSRTPKKTLGGRTYGSRPTGKPKAKLLDIVIRYFRKELGTSERKGLAMRQENGGRHVDMCRKWDAMLWWWWRR